MSFVNGTGANYNGRQPNNSAYIKTFVEGNISDLWSVKNVTISATNTSIMYPVAAPNLYIPGNIYHSGSIISIPPINLTTNVLYTNTSGPISTNTNIQQTQQTQQTQQQDINSLLTLIQELQNQVIDLQTQINILNNNL
jgi:hypothetical protein